MNYKIRSRTTNSDCLAHYRILFLVIFSFLLLLLVVTSVRSAEASVGGKVTFSWRPNPPEDYVIGYRLYYGASSRYNSSGTPKINFSYDYYIDFTDRERCVPSSSGPNCEILNLQELQCENLYGSVPRCTISNLQGQVYFALTAYNAQAESSFTPELISPKKRPAIQQVIAMLLFKKKKK